MSGLRGALIALAALATVLGLAALALALSSDHQAEWAVYAVFAPVNGWAFVAAGLVAWARRPANRIGPLMTAVGFAWFFGALVASDNGYVFATGLLLGSLAYAPFAHLLLAFPDGRLKTRFERVLVALAYLDVTVVQAAIVLFHDPRLDRECPRCPENALLIGRDEQLAGLIIGLQAVIGLFAIGGLVAVLIRRWRQAAPAQRRDLTLVFTAGAVVLLIVGLSLLADVTGLSDSVEAALDIVGVVLLSSVPFGFLAGLLRSRLARAGAVGELVERLGTGARRPHALRDLLADALGDPSLGLAYWVEEQGRYVDGEGRPVELPQPGSGRACTPVEREGRPVAAILHEPTLTDEPELVRAVGAAAALALENERLEAALRARIEELRASRARIVEVAVAERRRLERDLHDGAQQRLVALALSLRVARARLEEDPRSAASLLDEAADELARATDELREFARGIHPAVLADRGLGPALGALAGRAPLPVEIRDAPEERLPAPVELAAYFVVAEALTNVARYADATHAAVRVTRSDGRVVVEVRDDGVGGADAEGGSGLRGLADRLAALDGRLEVRSPAGGGTLVRADIPAG